MKVNFPILKLVPAEAGMGYKNEDCFDHGGAVTGAPFTAFLLAGAVLVRTGECLRAME